MTIQQAYQILGLEGSESLEAVEKRFAELYNDAHTRLVNEFDEARIAQLKQHIAEAQEALTVLKDLPAAAPTGAMPDPVPTQAEFLQLLGLTPQASTKQAAKALKSKQMQLQAMLQSSFSPEMSLLAEREQIRLEKAAARYLVPAKGTSATLQRSLRLVIMILGIFSVTTVSAFAVWKYLNNTDQERVNKVKAVREALRLDDMKQAYELYRDHKLFHWLKDSISGADRQRLITGFLDQTFAKTQKAVSEDAFENAKAGIKSLLEVRDNKELEQGWGYAWDAHLDTLGSVIFKRKMAAIAKNDFKTAGTCEVFRRELLSAEATDEQDWQATTAENTKDAYNQYKKEHPKGKFIADANQQLDILAGKAEAYNRALSEYHRLLREANDLFDSGSHDKALVIYQQANGKMPTLKEAKEGIRKCNQRQQEIDDYNRRDEQTFQAARNSIDLLKSYPQQFPKGKFVSQVQPRIAQLEAQAEKQAKREQAETNWQSIRNTKSIRVLQQFIADFPESEYVRTAKYRIQELEEQENERMKIEREKERERQEAERRRQAEEKVRNCSKCKGDGWKDSDCSRCVGGKCEVGTSDCTKCENGYGNFQCSSCQGYGKVRCNSCGGRGCIHCRGFGYYLCSACNHTGSVYESCGYCSGKGRISIMGTCTACGGDGILENNERCYH